MSPTNYCTPCFVKRSEISSSVGVDRCEPADQCAARDNCLPYKSNKNLQMPLYKAVSYQMNKNLKNIVVSQNVCIFSYAYKFLLF